MKTKLVVFALIAVFSVSMFAGTAWTEDPAKVDTKKSYRYHPNFFWIKIFFRLLKLEKKVAHLEHSVVQLEDDLDEEALERQSGDKRLKLIIDNEAETRDKADMGLEEEIDMEAEDREAADKRLYYNLVNETIAREDGDADLQEQIDSIETGAVEVPIFFSSGAVEIEPSASWRMGVGFLSFDVTYGIVMPMSGKIKNLVGYSLKSPDSDTDESFTFTVHINRSSTDVNCVVTDQNPCEDLVNSVDVKRGDKVAIVVQASSDATKSLVGASVVLENMDIGEKQEGSVERVSLNLQDLN